MFVTLVIVRAVTAAGRLLVTKGPAGTDPISSKPLRFPAYTLNMYSVDGRSPVICTRHSHCNVFRISQKTYIHTCGLQYVVLDVSLSLYIYTYIYSAPLLCVPKTCMWQGEVSLHFETRQYLCAWLHERGRKDYSCRARYGAEVAATEVAVGA